MTVKVIIPWKSTGKAHKHSPCIVMERGPFPQKQDVSECAMILMCATYLAGNG